MPSPRAADDARLPARHLRGFRRAHAALVGGAVVLAASLTACTGEPAGGPTPTRTASARPTAEPTPTPTTTPEPERPAAMDDPGVYGAVAAATYFLSLYPYVYNTGDLTAWKALSHPECVFCASVVTNVEEMHAKGHRQDGPTVTVEKAAGREVDPGVFFAVDVEMVQGASKELDATGKVVDEVLDPTNIRVSVAVVREGEHWIIRGSEATVASA